MQKAIFQPVYCLALELLQISEAEQMAEKWVVTVSEMDVNQRKQLNPKPG